MTTAITDSRYSGHNDVPKVYAITRVDCYSYLESQVKFTCTVAVAVQGCLKSEGPWLYVIT